jgi:hypothetical protein
MLEKNQHSTSDTSDSTDQNLRHKDREVGNSLSLKRCNYNFVNPHFNQDEFVHCLSGKQERKNTCL